jgi:hypothetical protein
VTGRGSGAAILGVVLAVTPAAKRPQMVKAAAVVAEVLVGLGVVLVGVVLMVGVYYQPPAATIPAPPLTSTPTTAAGWCQWRDCFGQILI